jgi:hypothetical protein
MGVRLAQSTRVQQATSFALLTCSAPFNQVQIAIETATMQASLWDILDAFRLFVPIQRHQELPITTPSPHHLRLRYA